MREHSRLPMPSDEEILSVYSSANHMRYRSAEKWQIPDCKKNGVPIRDLTRHLRKVHQMTRDFYNKNFTKIKHNGIRIPASDIDRISMYFPEEKDCIDKPDIGENDVVVEDDCMNCPITETLPRETQISVIDEEKDMHEDQKLAIKAFIEGKDIYFSASTGYGKSMVFQSLPFVVDALREQNYGTSTLIVIVPLRALAEDQVARMNRVGINAISLHDMDNGLEKKLNDVNEGLYSLIYASPESMLDNKYWRQIATSETFREHCIGVAIDEAHCIPHWGMDDKNFKPFRVWYSRLSELKSLLAGNLNFAIFTATATKTTQQNIIDNLGLSYDTLYLVQKNPDRPNIRYSVTYIDNTKELSETFSTHIANLKISGKNSPRTLIFCQTRKQCVLIYHTFVDSLGDEVYSCATKSPKSRIVDMFHAATPQSVKLHIIDQMTKAKSCLRLLICTVAFGMGVDCQDVHDVIHFGPSKNIELYLQESGRVGRDGLPSTSVILCNSLLSIKCDAAMRLYLRTNQCRRRQISANFDKFYFPNSLTGCKCCDICSHKCTCESGNCTEWLLFEKEVAKDCKVTKTRTVSDVQRTMLGESLKLYRGSIFGKFKEVKPVAFPNIFLDFDFYQIRQVIENCDKIFTINDVYHYVEIWRKVHANNVLAILEETFEDTDIEIEKLQLTDDEEDSDSLGIPET
eukprot:gene1046-372_t